MITQLLKPGKFMASPSISFGPSAVEADLRQETNGRALLPVVIARQKRLLAEHCLAFGGDPGL